MIKRLILILGLTMACAGLSHAQYAFPSEITSKGSRILVDGEKLTAQQAAQLAQITAQVVPSNKVCDVCGCC